MTQKQGNYLMPEELFPFQVDALEEKALAKDKKLGRERRGWTQKRSGAYQGSPLAEAWQLISEDE